MLASLSDKVSMSVSQRVYDLMCNLLSVCERRERERSATEEIVGVQEKGVKRW